MQTGFPRLVPVLDLKMRQEARRGQVYAISITNSISKRLNGVLHGISLLLINPAPAR
jgi:hypothetical protein